MVKIQLISAPTDEGRIPLYEDGVFAPLSLIWLGSYLKKQGYDIEILDGQHQNLKTIISELDASIVGINFNIFSTNSLDKIAEAAKQKGSIVVIGGQAATPLAKELLENSNIDYVIRYDGEEALQLLAEGKEVKEIPNLVYREEKKVIENSVRLMDLTRLPAIDWNLKGINVQVYWKRFDRLLKNINTHHIHQKPLSSLTKKGCPMRQNNDGCSFCSRIDTLLRSKTPQQVYDEFKYLVDLGADRIEEFSDSWLYDKKWLREFADLVKRKGHFGVPIRVYADTRHFDLEVIKLMQIIKIDSVVLGIESGNENILRKNGKLNTIKQILYCAKLLKQAGIKASPSYVFGLIGETKETVEDTFRLADKINSLCEIEMSYYSIMTPFSGSKAWNMLMSDPLMQKKYVGYRLDPENLQRDFIAKFTDLGKDGLTYLTARLNQRFNEESIAQRDY